MEKIKKNQHRRFFGAAGVTTIVAARITAFAAQEHPNVIIFFTDDHGWADLGIQSSQTDVKTPYTDQLARDGVRFSDGHSTAPQCVPSRAGLMTGRYQTRFNMETNHDGPLPLSEKTIADRLRTAGYVTGMVGKWHLERTRESKNRPADVLDSEYQPGNRGFDEYWNGCLRQYGANIDLDGNKLLQAKTITDNRFRIDVQTDAALSFLKRRTSDKKPFFLYVAYFAPHVPLEKPEKYMERFKDVPDETRRMALAAISAIDDGVGRIRDYLEKNGLSQDTVIFYMADNGAPRRPNAWDGSLNDPMAGEKGMLTDGGTRVPFLMAWPGHIPAGQIYNYPVITMDATATALALSGQPVAPEMDGVNLMPFVTGERADAPHETFFWRWRSQAAVLENGWKLWYVAPDHWFLFADTGTTPEKENVIDQYPEVTKRLKDKLMSFVSVQDPPGLPSELHPADKLFMDVYYGKSGETEAASAEKDFDPGQAFKEWTARNCTIQITPDGLAVCDAKTSPPPFLTVQKISIPIPATLKITLTAEKAGRGSVGWRTKNTRDFLPQNKADFTFNEGQQTVSVLLPVPEEETVIHFRLILPYAEQKITIQSISLQSTLPDSGKRWDF